MRIVIEEHCFNCGYINLVDNGDCNDLTVPDVEGFICYNCKSINVFAEDGYSIYIHDNDDDFYVVYGEKKDV